MKYAWKILDIDAADGLITKARYHVTLQEKGIQVETEGNWFFQEPKLKVPFAEVTEEMVAGWVQNETTEDGKNKITSRLIEQLNELKAKQTTVPPWMPQTFTPEL